MLDQNLAREVLACAVRTGGDLPRSSWRTGWIIP